MTRDMMQRRFGGGAGGGFPGGFDMLDMEMHGSRMGGRMHGGMMGGGMGGGMAPMIAPGSMMGGPMSFGDELMMSRFNMVGDFGGKGKPRGGGRKPDSRGGDRGGRGGNKGKGGMQSGQVSSKAPVAEKKTGVSEWDVLSRDQKQTINKAFNQSGKPLDEVLMTTIPDDDARQQLLELGEEKLRECINTFQLSHQLKVPEPNQVFRELTSDQKDELKEHLKIIPYKEAIELLGMSEMRTKGLLNLGKTKLKEAMERIYGEGSILMVQPRKPEQQLFADTFAELSEEQKELFLETLSAQPFVIAVEALSTAGVSEEALEKMRGGDFQTGREVIEAWKGSPVEMPDEEELKRALASTVVSEMTEEARTNLRKALWSQTFDNAVTAADLDPVTANWALVAGSNKMKVSLNEVMDEPVLTLEDNIILFLAKADPKQRQSFKNTFASNEFEKAVDLVKTRFPLAADIKQKDLSSILSIFYEDFRMFESLQKGGEPASKKRRFN